MSDDGVPFCNVSETALAVAARTRARFPTLRVAVCVLRLFPGVTRDVQRAALEHGIGVWCQPVTRLTSRFVDSPDQLADGEALILVDCRRIDGPGLVLAESELANGTLRPVRQWYDSERFVFSDRPQGDQIDLGAVAAHEIGHALGIPHLGPDALMGPRYVPGRRTPQREDVEEAVARYGRHQDGPAWPPQPVPPAGRTTTVVIDWAARTVRVEGQA